jgi:hypothetical protein
MYDVEILLLAQCLGCRVREVPIRWRDDGDSRLDLVHGNLRNLRDILRLRARAKAAGCSAPGPPWVTLVSGHLRVRPKTRVFSFGTSHYEHICVL